MPGLAVYHNVVEVARQHADDLLQICIHAAIAALVLRPAYRKERKAVCLDHGVEDPEPGLVEQFDGLALGLPSSALFMTARRMSSRDDVTFTPSAVESPTAGSASIARTLEPGRSSVRTRTMAAASDVFPTPPLPARAIILACPVAHMQTTPKYAKERVRRCGGPLSRYLLYI